MKFSGCPGKNTEESIARKLQEYLLNPEHTNPQGYLSGKAMWFRNNLGFTRYNANELAKQIKFNRLFAKFEELTDHGQKYSQAIKIVGANGKTKIIVFIWIENTDGVVRLVSIKHFPKYRGEQNV